MKALLLAAGLLCLSLFTGLMVVIAVDYATAEPLGGGSALLLGGFGALVMSALVSVFIRKTARPQGKGPAGKAGKVRP